MTSISGPTGGWRYDYDPWGNVAEATQLLPTGAVASPIVQSYTYDALDRPFEKTRRLPLPTGPTSITTEKYTHTGLSTDLASRTQTVTALQDVVKTESFYSHMDGQPLGELTKITVLGPVPASPTWKNRHIGLNPHGDVAYTDQGQIFSSYTYDPWGMPRSSVGDTTYLGYQGDPTDEDTKLVDMGARLYVPELGRFTTQDPLEGDLTNPISVNPYIYGIDDPVSNWDPTGMKHEGPGDGACRCPGAKPPTTGGSGSGSGAGGGSSSAGGGSSSSSNGTREGVAIGQAWITRHESGENWLDFYNKCTGDIAHCWANNNGWLMEWGYIPDTPNPNSWLDVALDISTVLSVAGLARAAGRWVVRKAAEGAAKRALAGQLAGGLRAALRSKAGFADEGLPLIVDNSLGVNPQRVAAALRSRGYNARSVTEIFGPDPGDAAISQLASQLSGRVLSVDKTGFGALRIPIDPRVRQVDSVLRIVGGL
jgi:RHS repeat-associated protein